MAVAAQQLPLTPLKPANGGISDSGMSLAAIRELSDGRVLTPGGSKGMLAVDFEKKSVEPHMGVPSGRLYRLAGDSTLLEVNGTGWVLLDGTRVLGMLPTTNAVVALASPVYGVDAVGHVLAASGGQPKTDSASVFIVDRATGAREFITKVWQQRPAKGGEPAPAYVVREEPSLMFDGWIAVVRAHPYRVDWRSPAGIWTLGKPIAIALPKLDARERAAYSAQFPFPTSSGAAPENWWPATVEAFDYPMPIGTSDGNVLVLRASTADFPGILYDVVNRRGDLEQEFMLSRGTLETVAGFGAHSIYTMAYPAGRRPARLERHPWP